MDVSLLGLGTVKLGRNQQLKYPQAFTLPDDKTATALLHRAQALGVNLLDTAPAYGSSEERLGELLRGRRKDWLICTKVGEEFENGTSRFDFTPEHVHQSIKRSLQRLHTDYLDVVLIHSDGNDVKIIDKLGTLGALQDLKQHGYIRAVGLSHKTVAGAERALELGCDVIMATLNPEATDEAAVIARAGEQQCGVLIKKALASGHGGPDSLVWVAAQCGVSSIVTGTIDPEHLAANAAALGVL
jgi:aryl-alcohol dehydrogenase-like predicted oxidoreductase